MKALLKPIVWVCLFFFAYQSTYAQALKIMSYNCRMSGEMTGYSVKEYAVFIRKYNPDVVMLQEIDYNTKGIKIRISPLNWLRSWDCFPYLGKQWILVVENME